VFVSGYSNVEALLTWEVDGIGAELVLAPKGSRRLRR
jgi:hypothetical protein